MRDYYVGDVNDFFKFTIIEKIVELLHVKPLIVWMRTKGEGMDIEYADCKKYNEKLFVELQDIIKSNTRTVKSIETLYPDYFFLSEFLENANRKKYFAKAKQKSENCGLVFFDPDTGIGPNNKRDIHHLYWDEIKQFWESNKDIIIYQHFKRRLWIDYLHEIDKEIKANFANALLIPIKTKNVMFLYITHDNNIKEKLKKSFEAWDNRIEIFEIKESK